MGKILGLAIVFGINPHFGFNSFSFKIDTDSGGSYNLYTIGACKAIDRYGIYRDFEKLNQ